MSILQLNPGSAVAKQQMTGVIKAYRNKKLATYLKAIITSEAFARFPEIEKIETNCYSVNTPIIHLNKRLGYKLRKRSFQFNLPAEHVKALTS
ncbi:MAG TPA: hypothetical protein VIM89_10255 [Mucilaginibacter sp.]